MPFEEKVFLTTFFKINLKLTRTLVFLALGLNIATFFIFLYAKTYAKVSAESVIRISEPLLVNIKYFPKTILNFKIITYRPEADVLEVKRRYQNMYIPSDFFSTNFRWVDAFPPHMPFTLNKPCSFHVMHKDVDSVAENTAILEPPDADYLFSAKVSFIITNK